VTDLSVAVALAEAGTIASSVLEVRDARELEIVRRHASAVALALALLLLEFDTEFAPRWRAAGSDWMGQADVLHDALMFVLTPEAVTP
jgi:hypothetical protein